MALAIRKPSTSKKGLKVLVFGDTGTSKTTFTLTFPKSLILDSETGTSWYEDESPNIAYIVNTQDYNDIIEGIEKAEELARKGEISTLVIDSETKFYQNLQNVILQLEEKRARKKGRDELDASVSQRGWGKIKSISTRLQNLKLDLSAKGIHVVSVAQEDEIKEKQGENMIRVGERASMAKKSEYDYDIVLRTFTETDFNGDTVYKAEVRKDRTKTNKKGDILEDVSFDIWSDIVNKVSDKEVLATTLSKDEKKATDTQISKDKERVDGIVAEFKEIMTNGSSTVKAEATTLIKSSKIANPLKPKDMAEKEKLVEIVDKLNKLQ